MSYAQRRRLYDEFVKWGFDNRGWSPRTRDKYQERANAADRWLTEKRDVPLLFAKPRDVKAYLFSTAPNARNRNNIRQALLAFFNFLVDAEYRDDNPASALPRLPEPECQPKALTAEESRKVAVAAKAHGPDAEAAVMLMLYAGLRKTEARTLQWRMIDLDKGWITFKGKGSRERTVPIHESVTRALTKQKIASDHPVWVFPSPKYDSRALSDTSMRHLIREVGDEAGIPGVHPHVLRHSFATRLIELGVDPSTVQNLLGHASLATTQMYIRIRPARSKEAVDKLDFLNYASNTRSG